MHVAFVVNNFPPRVGGVENHVAALSRRLAELGHEVHVHTLSEGGRGRTLEGGVVVHRWTEWFQIGGLLGFPTLPAARGIAKAVRDERPDIVSVHTRFFPLSWLGAWVGKRLGVPVLHTEHGSDHVASSSPLISGGSRLVDVTLGRWTLRAADAVVGVSEEVTAFVQRLAGVEAEVFYNAIEPPSETGFTPRRHLVFVGRLVAGKGWEDFLEVLVSQDQDVTGELLGDGPDLPRLRDEVARLGLSDRAIVRGRVTLEGVYSALRGAILVNPTRLSEGFQTTLLEALAVGARIVSYRVPGVGRLLGAGAPVRVVADIHAMASAVREELDSPSGHWPSERMAEWTWPDRAQEFADRAEAVIRRRQLRS